LEILAIHVVTKIKPDLACSVSAKSFGPAVRNHSWGNFKNISNINYLIVMIMHPLEFEILGSARIGGPAFWKFQNTQLMRWPEV
jgi:hypothetical protein